MAATNEEAIVISDKDKFELSASEGAPKLYPMEIIAGSFFSPDGSSFSVPNKVTLHNGWGEGRSIWSDTRLALPDRLVIRFFSYTEDKFYRGDFRLPYTDILALFKAGYISPRDGEQITYDQLNVGIAPGGYVSVWAEGLDRRTEVFSAYAEEEEGDWLWIVDNPDITRQEFIQVELEDAPDVLNNLKQNGIPFGLWETYNRRYSWQLVLNGMAFEDNLLDQVDYFNGELDYLYYSSGEQTFSLPRAVPSNFYFVWAREGQEGRVVKLKLDEAEVIAAFAQQGSSGQALQLEFRMVKKPNGKYDLTLWLHNEKDSLELKKLTINTYSKP